MDNVSSYFLKSIYKMSRCKTTSIGLNDDSVTVKDEEIKAEAAKVFWSFLANSRGSTSPNLDGMRLWNLKLKK
ncbi:hypothetical protein GBA52_010792 [Prunus armeniaca]|nr:hypothetical protein GBA52_010792 [Prunus armeniaca]